MPVGGSHRAVAARELRDLTIQLPDGGKVLLALALEFMNSIIRMEAAEEVAAERFDALRRRDPNDIEWSSLAITLEADGVFTTDKDIIEEGGVRIFKFGDAIKIVSTLRRGRLATTIQIQTAMVALVVAGGLATTMHALKQLARLLEKFQSGSG